MNRIKKSAVICLVCSMLAGTAVLSANVIGEQIEKNEVRNAVEMSAESSRNVLESNMNADSLTELLRAQGLEDDEVQKMLDAYATLIVLYNPSEDEKAHMLEMARDGKNLQMICDIYAFLTDTVEGFSLMDTMYALGDAMHFSDSYWLESTYNYATENRHGTLSLKEIEEYIAKGITVEEISAASVLSRGGNGTITQILDERAEGKVWTDIFNGYYQIETLDFSSAQSGESASDLLDGVQTARISGLKAAVCVKNKESVFEIQNKKMLEARSFAQKAGAGLLKKEELTQKIYDAVSDTGVGAEEIRTLQDNGFTSSEIKNAAETARESGEDLTEVLNAESLFDMR